MAIRSLCLSGLLSFAPESAPFELRRLNVLIGPNGSGKSNLIEAIQLLASTPERNFLDVIREGGGPSDWLWKGAAQRRAEIDAVLDGGPTGRPLRYRIELAANQSRLEIFDEAIEDVEPAPGGPVGSGVSFYYRFRRGDPIFKDADGTLCAPPSFQSEISVLAQPHLLRTYPEVKWVSDTFESFDTFRERCVGRHVALRQPQRMNLRSDRLLPDNRNLALVLNQIEHSDNAARLNELMRRFFPRFEHLSTHVLHDKVAFYLHESAFGAPIAAKRLSDGTIRFIALLATLLSTNPPPLLCIEEPELGLHPDVLTWLGELLVEASEKTQLIVTTHSDALVSALTNHVDAVVTCERPGAATVLRRLESDRLASWLEEYRLGDLWRIGELGANP